MRERLAPLKLEDYPLYDAVLKIIEMAECVHTRSLFSHLVGIIDFKDSEEDTEL